MRGLPRAYRLIVVTAAAVSVGTIAGPLSAPAMAAPSALAVAVPQQAVRPDAIASAAVQPAPAVTDAGLGARSKRGLAAPVMSAAMHRANAQRQAAASALLQVMASRGGPGLKCATAVCRAGLPAALDLARTQQPQARNYFCGPATVSEMLAQVGVQLRQPAAARELGTSASGTDWSDAGGYPVPRVLNQNQTRNRYVAVALPWTPTARQLATYEIDLVTDINANGGVPLAGNAYEVAGGPHLVGNPVDQTIMHWFDIRGYQKYGAITDYEDSVHSAGSIGWALNVPAYSAMPSAVIVDILGARGYDW